MDNSVVDMYGIFDYFLGTGDDAARNIAEKGRAWADMVLRREDIYAEPPARVRETLR
jgi:hypothetical protein